MINVTLLPDHLLGEVIDRTHDHDLLALLSSCKTFKRVLSLDTAREVKPPPKTYIVTSVALLEWALGNGWAWPTKAADLEAEMGGHLDSTVLLRGRVKEAELTFVVDDDETTDACSTESLNIDSLIDSGEERRSAPCCRSSADTIIVPAALTLSHSQQQHHSKGSLYLCASSCYHVLSRFVFSVEREPASSYRAPDLSLWAEGRYVRFKTRSPMLHTLREVGGLALLLLLPTAMNCMLELIPSVGGRKPRCCHRLLYEWGWVPPGCLRTAETDRGEKVRAGGQCYRQCNEWHCKLSTNIIKGGPRWTHADTFTIKTESHWERKTICLYKDVRSLSSFHKLAIWQHELSRPRPSVAPQPHVPLALRSN